MAEHVAPVLTIPQARALLAAIPRQVRAIEVRLAADAQRGGNAFDTLSVLSGGERRMLAAQVRSLQAAAVALRRVVPEESGS